MHIVAYTDRDGHAAEAILSQTVWAALIEIAESRGQTPADLCRHVDMARTEECFADGLETFLYRYYRAKNPDGFAGMNDGDPADTRFEHGLRGVAKDTAPD